MGMLNMLLSCGEKAFTATWSGNSIRPNNGGGAEEGMETSGSSYRMYFHSTVYSYGAWGTANIDGTFSGDSKPTLTASGIGVSGNLIRTALYNADIGATSYGAWVTFTKTLKVFTGSSYISATEETMPYHETLETNGGLIRFGSDGGFTMAYGSYISLT